MGALVAGHKKDVVLTALLGSRPGKVAIYGWHRLDGKPIQPLYTGHTDRWVDYSHGIRLVSRAVLIDGEERDMAEVLRDTALAGILSDEGVIMQARYSPVLGDSASCAITTFNKSAANLSWRRTPAFLRQTLPVEGRPRPAGGAPAPGTQESK